MLFNQSKSHYPKYNGEFVTKDNEEENKELEQMEESDRVLKLLFYLFSLTGTITLTLRITFLSRFTHL